MNTMPLSLVEEKWLEKQLPPCPDVFVIACAGTSVKAWKLVAMLSKTEYDEPCDWEARVKRMFSSAIAMRAFMVTPSNDKGTNEP